MQLITYPGHNGGNSMSSLREQISNSRISIFIVSLAKLSKPFRTIGANEKKLYLHLENLVTRQPVIKTFHYMQALISDQRAIIKALFPELIPLPDSSQD